MFLSLLWCIVGAATGFLAAGVMHIKGHGNRVENVLVGVFGAFIGGEFLASKMTSGAPDGGFRASSLGLAVLGAVAMLVLLSVMRKAVGPLGQKARKKRS
jgi:uncharacterized membrane protein YeaQ/YmgE (transglycosylase-associated protein family)